MCFIFGDEFFEKFNFFIKIIQEDFAEKIKISILWSVQSLSNMAYQLCLSKRVEGTICLPGFLACKDAELQSGQKSHWDIFDRIQKAHLVECLNVGDFDILKKCAEDIGLDVEKWGSDYNSDEVFQNLAYNIELARHYHINGIPTLVANGRYGIVSAYKYDVLSKWLDKVREEFKEGLK